MKGKEEITQTQERQEEDSSERNTVENNKVTEKKLEKKSNRSEMQEVPRGKPKSGRIWKEPRKRFKSIIKSKSVHSSFEEKQKLREELKRVKEMSRAIKEEKQAQKEAKKQRRIANLKRAEENNRKSEIVQVIKNPAKIKKMKKKQLRSIEKRDTLNM